MVWIMESKIKTTIGFRVGIMEKKLETTIVYLDSISGLCRDNGKEHGNYYRISVLYIDNGKENENYYSILGVIHG